MGSYIANTEKQKREMLKEIGLERFDDLFKNIPDAVKDETLNIPPGLSEMEVIHKMESTSQMNTVFKHVFRGAGSYDHYVPAIVASVIGKEGFLTAYTPYQPEISQGILQSIFEYQTMICELTGMEVANASVYDGATAAAEAIAMCRERGRMIAYVSATVNPEVIEVIKTYCYGSGTQLELIPEKDGVTDLRALEQALNESSACFYVQQPNYYGNVEDADALGKIVHQAGAKYIMGCNPIALAVMKTPAGSGADIVVGEGQPLGMEIAFGGPYLGFMATGKNLVRRLPGRIVGETKDKEGKRAYVLTLQTREQHIRREKASSNICSNQALCALTAGAYMAAMGESGMKKVAELCTSKAHYLQGQLLQSGLLAKFNKPYFHEFVTTSESSAGEILAALEAKDILGGLPLNDHDILWCATEKNTKEEMDQVAAIVKEVCRG